MQPSQWHETVWVQILAILAAYIRKWSGPDSPDGLSPDERDEIRSRIVMDIMTGDPGELSPLHFTFRTARKWRMRGWAGDTETHRELMRGIRAKAKQSLRDPGSAESEESRNKSPFRGSSADSKTPTPLAMMIAAESAVKGELRYVSDRQRKARRRPVKGNPPAVTYRIVPVGTVGRPRVGFGQNGRPLYFSGAATRISYVAIPGTIERGEYCRRTKAYRPHVPYTGKLANREVGKVKADPVPAGMIREAFAGDVESRRHVRNPIPAPIPATPGDGTEFRPADCEWQKVGPGEWRRLN